MTDPIIVPGASYSDNLPTGAYVDLFWGSHLDTSARGRVELPPWPRPADMRGQSILHHRIAADGVRFAGTGHDGVVKDRAQEWNGAQWIDYGVAHGLNACIYNGRDELVVARPGAENTTGSTGFRDLDDAGNPISCESTTSDVGRRIWEFTTHGDCTIGQGGKGIYGEDPVVALYAGRRILIATGQNRFVHFRRWNVNGVDTLSLAWWAQHAGSCKRLIMPVAELLSWPLARDAELRIAPFPKPLHVAAFYVDSTKYGSTPDYPVNTSIVIAETDGDGKPFPLDHVKAAAARVPIIINCTAEIFDYVKREGLAPRVAALFIGDTGGATNADVLATQAKAMWAARGLPARPMFWYLTRGDADRPGFAVPASIDWLGPEFYFESPDDLGNQLWRKTGYWIEKLGPSGKPWMIVAQAYDRNGSPAFTSRMDDVAALQPAFLEIFRTPDARVKVIPPHVGIAFFAVNRPGGAKDYPQLRVAHAAINAAVPGAPPIVDTTKPPDPTKPKPPKPTEPTKPDPFITSLKEVKMSETKIVAIKGPGGKFGRPDRVGTGPFGEGGWHGMLFDRDEPDDDCKFEMSKPDDLFKFKHTKIAGMLGLDAAHGLAVASNQFYLKPNDDRGAFESISVYKSPRTGKTVAFVETFPGEYPSCAFQVVEL